MPADGRGAGASGTAGVAGDAHDRAVLARDGPRAARAGRRVAQPARHRPVRLHGHHAARARPHRQAAAAQRAQPGTVAREVTEREPPVVSRVNALGESVGAGDRASNKNYYITTNYLYRNWGRFLFTLTLFVGITFLLSFDFDIGRKVVAE